MYLTHRSQSVPPSSKMAAAAFLNFDETLLVCHISPDLDEIWYVYQEKHAVSVESKLQISNVENDDVLER